MLDDHLRDSGGERDPLRLAKLRHEHCHNGEATIAQALVSEWRAEHLVTLQQTRELYRDSVESDR